MLRGIVLSKTRRAGRSFDYVALVMCVFLCSICTGAEERVNADPPIEPSAVWAYPPTLPAARVATYKKVGDVALNAFIYTPEGHQSTDRRPAIVFFFGGGWRAGTPGQFDSQCRYLAKRGMVAITADYRVRNRHGVLPQQCLADAKSAIRWVRRNADELGIDPQRIAAGGGSAGGHLAVATACIKAFDEPSESPNISSAPNLLVLFNPAVQLAALDDLNPFDPEKLDDIRERTGGDPESISPAHHVRKGLPPTIIFHGTNDDAAPFVTVEHFAKAMRASGNQCRLESFEDRPHGFFNAGRGRDPENRSRSISDHRETIRLCDAFLIEHKYLAPRPSSDVPKGLQSELDVVYAKYGARSMTMDVFHPQSKSGMRPAIVVVHGGGWLKGDKEKFRPLAIELASRGFVTAAISYRLGGEAKFPAAIRDCNAAVKFLRANHSRWGIDPDRIGAVGGSAGGHLVGLMAAGSHVRALHGEALPNVSSSIQAAVVMAGPLELATGPVAEKSRTQGDKSNANQWIGKTVDEAPELYRLASATTHFTKQTPPILFMTGEMDNPTRNSAAREQLQLLAVETGLAVISDGNHGCWNRHPFFLPMIDQMHAFFATHLRVD